MGAGRLPGRFLAVLVMAGAVQTFCAPVAGAQTSVPETYPETLRWYHEQAAAGNADALFLLAVKYETGTDVERDPARAAELFERAARQGHADSQFKLATMLAAGRGIDRNPERAENLYRAAALQHHAPAQYNYAVTLLSHAENEDDLVEALSWLMRSAEGGLRQAQDLRDRWLEKVSETVASRARELSQLALHDSDTAR